MYIFFLAKISVFKWLNLFAGRTDLLRNDTHMKVCDRKKDLNDTSESKKLDKKKAHKDQNDLDGRTFVFTVDCLGHFHLLHQFPKVVTKKVLNPRWKTVVVGVFLEDNAAGVLKIVKDRKNHRDGPTWGNSLWLKGWTRQSAMQFTGTVHQFYLLVCFLSPCPFYNAFFVSMFMFITECQIVLKLPGLSKPRVISVVRVMTPCFLPLRIYSQNVVFIRWGSGDVVVVLV